MSCSITHPPYERSRADTGTTWRTRSSPHAGRDQMEGAHLLEGERGTGAAGQEPPACRIVINDAGSRPDRLDAARTGVAEEPTALGVAVARDDKHDRGVTSVVA